MPQIPQFIAVMPTFRRANLLETTIETVLQQTLCPTRIVIVDNGDDAATRQLVAQYRRNTKTEITLICPGENLGSAGGWQFGIEHALIECSDDDWILILDDDDPPIGSDEIEKMWQFALEQSSNDDRVAGVGIVGARFNWGLGIIQRLDDAELTGAVDVDYVGNGHVAFYSARVFREFGLFQGELFFGNTEVEYGLRLRKNGYRLLANSSLWRQRRELQNRVGIQVRPAWTSTTDWRKYYVIRNHIYMLKTQGRFDLAVIHAIFQSLIKPLFTFMRSPRSGLAALRQNTRASWDGIFGRLGKRVEPESAPRAE